MLELAGFEQPPSAVGIGGDGRHLAIARGRRVCIAQGTAPLVCQGEFETENEVGELALSRDGTRVLVDRGVTLRTFLPGALPDGPPLAESFGNGLGGSEVFFGPGDSVCAINVDPGGLEEESYTMIECVSEYGETVISGDFPSSSLVSTAVSHAGHFVVAAVDSDQVEVLRAGEGSLTLPLPNLVQAGEFAGGRGVFAASDTGRIAFFDARSGRSLGPPLQLEGGIPAQVVPLGEGIVAQTLDGGIYRWASRWLIREEGKGAPAPSQHDVSASWYDAPPRSSAGNVSIEGAEGRWSVIRTGREPLTLEHPLPMDDFEAEALAEGAGVLPVTSADLSGDGSVAVTAAGNDALIVWDAMTGAPLRRIERAGEHLYARAVYVDTKGRRALVVYDNSFRADRYCYETGIQQYSLVDLTGPTSAPEGDSLPIGRVIRDVTPDLGSALVTKGSNLWVIDPVTGAAVTAVAVTEGAVLDATFDPSGRRFAAATRNGLIYVWDMATGLPIADRYVFDPDPPQNRGAPCEDDYAWSQGRLRFSPDGQRVAMRVHRGTDPETDSQEILSSWRVGYGLDEDAVSSLAEAAERIAGMRFTSTGAVERFHQPSLAEFRAEMLAADPALADLLPTWLTASNADAP